MPRIHLTVTRKMLEWVDEKVAGGDFIDRGEALRSLVSRAMENATAGAARPPKRRAKPQIVEVPDFSAMYNDSIIAWLEMRGHIDRLAQSDRAVWPCVRAAFSTEGERRLVVQSGEDESFGSKLSQEYDMNALRTFCMKLERELAESGE